MHDIGIILTITGGFVAALSLGYLSHRLGLSPIVGYLVSGIIVSPHTPGFVADRAVAEQLAEIGVILLMFGVGLHFHIKELLQVRRIAIPGAVVQSVAATILGAAAAVWFGWDIIAGLVFGVAISVASTVVLTRILADNNELHTRTGHIAVGWLVMEDLFTVFILVLLPAIFINGNDLSGVALSDILLSLGLASVKIALLVAVTFVGGSRLIPKLLTLVAKTNSRELFTLAVLAIALGIAVGSALIFNVSMALGAFLAGMVVGRSDFSLRAASEALPMRDAFAVLFFVSVGMLFNWQAILEAPLFVASAVLIIVVGKPLAAAAILLAMRYPLKVTLSVSCVLSQIGEFSFILGAMGLQLGVLPESASNILVFSAILSITTAPIAYQNLPAMQRFLERAFPRFTGWVEVRSTPSEAGADTTIYHESARKAIIVGFGPVGKTVYRILKDNDVEPVVVELNLDTVKELKSQGIPAVYGDASKIDTFAKAGVDNAMALVLSVPLADTGRDAIRQVHAINPDIKILARTNYISEKEYLLSADIDEVFSAEEEVALSMSESILRHLGATPEQIEKERERERIHNDLYARPA